MAVILNMPRAMTLKFSGAHFAKTQVPHPETGELVDNALANFAGQEIQLHAGINHVIDEVALDPRVARFVVKPDDAAMAPKAPQAPAVPTQGSAHTASEQRAAHAPKAALKKD